MSNKFFSPLSRFPPLFQTCPKISTTFCKFSAQISLFSTSIGTIAAIVTIVPARMSKDSQIDFFVIFFSSNVLIQFFDQ